MILGTICARGGSKGVPGKNIKFLTKTLKQITTIKLFDKIVVSSDDASVFEASHKFPVTRQYRPPELATDTASKWDVFRYIAKQNKLHPYDILVDLDIGCPLRAPEDITACIDKLQAGRFDVVCTAYESERNPYFNMVEHGWGNTFFVVANGTMGENAPTSFITRRQDAPRVYSISPAVFAIRVGALLAFSHWSQARMGIVEIPRERAWDIDTELDLRIVEFLMRSK